MPRRKQARHTDVKDIRSILRLTFEQGLSIRAVSERLKMSKTSVSTYLLRARESGLAVWPLPPGLDDDDVLERRLFRRIGRPPRDTDEPNWPKVASELKRKGVTLNLLWQEYREAYPDGYGDTWFYCRFADHESRAKPTYRNRHVGGVAMECDYAGHTIPIIDPSTGEIRAAQIYVAVLSASQLTFSYASFSQKLPDWIEANQQAFSYFGDVTKTTICDNLKSAVAKALWFEPTLNATFAAFADHYDMTLLPARPRRPRDKPSAEGTVLIVERWVLARLRNDRFFSLVDLNIRISALIEDLNARTMRRYGKSRRILFDEVERSQLKPLPSTPFEYAEWKVAKVHPDYHVEVDKTFYSVPHGLIGRRVDIRLTYRAVEIFFDYKRVASHIRSSQRSGHVTINEHMPKAHQRYANTTPHTLRKEAAKVGSNTAIFIERLLCDRPHPEQGYRSAQGVLSLARRYESERLELACERALVINALSYSSVANILRSGLDQAPATSEAVKPAPPHGNIRGKTYYQRRGHQMLTHPTLDQMNALGLACMATAYRELIEQAHGNDLSFDERPGLMLDREIAVRTDRRLTNRLATAKLRFANASIEDVDFGSHRGLDRRHVLSLAQGAWPKANENLILTGQTGTGKTWIACAFARQAARLDYSVLYVRMLRLF